MGKSKEPLQNTVDKKKHSHEIFHLDCFGWGSGSHSGEFVFAVDSAFDSVMAFIDRERCANEHDLLLFRLSASCWAG